MTINSEQFQEICNGVWRDRAMLFKGRGSLSSEAALMRAFHWRLSRAEIKPVLSAENYAVALKRGCPHTSSRQLTPNSYEEAHARTQYLYDLVQGYKNELRESC